MLQIVFLLFLLYTSTREVPPKVVSPLFPVIPAAPISWQYAHVLYAPFVAFFQPVLPNALALITMELIITTAEHTDTILFKVFNVVHSFLSTDYVILWHFACTNDLLTILKTKPLIYYKHLKTSGSQLFPFNCITIVIICQAFRGCNLNPMLENISPNTRHLPVTAL